MSFPFVCFRPDASESSQAQNGAEQPFNLVLLGKDGLASEVNLEIRVNYVLYIFNL